MSSKRLNHLTGQRLDLIFREEIGAMRVKRNDREKH
jgi:hypothetical protein